jgi:hypothetical protein
MDDIRGFLKENILPEDDVTVDDLYRHGMDRVLLRCISREEGGELLTDIHEGECGSHSSSRTMVGTAYRQGFL